MNERSEAHAALNDVRRQWPHAEGQANGPRLAEALASQVAAGDSLADVAAAFDVPMGDVVLALRVSLREALDAIDVLHTRIVDQRELLQDAWNQFSIGGQDAQGSFRYDGGLSTLEAIAKELFGHAHPARIYDAPNTNTLEGV